MVHLIGIARSHGKNGTHFGWHVFPKFVNIWTTLNMIFWLSLYFSIKQDINLNSFSLIPWIINAFHLVFLKYFLFKYRHLPVLVKFTQVQSSTMSFNRMFFSLNGNHLRRKRVSFTMFISPVSTLYGWLMCVFGCNLWLKPSGGRGVGEKPEYLEKNRRLDCQHFLPVQEERKSVKMSAGRKFIPIYVMYPQSTHLFCNVYHTKLSIKRYSSNIYIYDILFH